MAELIGLGASILSIAAFGVTVVTTLRKFSGTYTAADYKINLLSADVSLTCSILTELGNTIEEYEKDLHITAHNFTRVKAACERDFERLSKALKIAKKDDEVKDEVPATRIGKKKAIPPLTAWERLKFALGGEDELKELMSSLETAKSNLQLLLDSVNLIILKKLSQKNVLDEEQSADLRDLVRHIPILVKVLQGAEFVTFKAKITKAQDTSPAKGAIQSEESKETPPAYTNKEPSNMMMMVNVAKIPDLPPIENEKELVLDEESPTPAPSVPPAPPLPKGVSGDATNENPISPTPIKPLIQSDLAKPDDQAATDTILLGFNGAKTGDVKTEDGNEKQEAVKAPATSSITEQDIFYEGWLLQKNKHILKKADTSLSIMGLPILKSYSTHNYYSTESDDDDERLFKILPHSNDQVVLKEQATNFENESKGGKLSTETRVKSILRSFHKVARDEIKRLIRHRQNSSPRDYEWVIIAIVPVKEVAVRKLLKVIEGDRGIKRYSKHLIIIRGGLMEKEIEDSDSAKPTQLPRRHKNLWLKPGDELLPALAGPYRKTGFTQSAPFRPPPPPPPQGYIPYGPGPSPPPAWPVPRNYLSEQEALMRGLQPISTQPQGGSRPNFKDGGQPIEIARLTPVEIGRITKATTKIDSGGWYSRADELTPRHHHPTHLSDVRSASYLRTLSPARTISIKHNRSRSRHRHPSSSARTRSRGRSASSKRTGQAASRGRNDSRSLSPDAQMGTAFFSDMTQFPSTGRRASYSIDSYAGIDGDRRTTLSTNYPSRGALPSEIMQRRAQRAKTDAEGRALSRGVAQTAPATAGAAPTRSAGYYSGPVRPKNEWETAKEKLKEPGKDDFHLDDDLGLRKWLELDGLERDAKKWGWDDEELEVQKRRVEEKYGREKLEKMSRADLERAAAAGASPVTDAEKAEMEKEREKWETMKRLELARMRAQPVDAQSAVSTGSYTSLNDALEQQFTDSDVVVVDEFTRTSGPAAANEATKQKQKNKHNRGTRGGKKGKENARTSRPGGSGGVSGVTESEQWLRQSVDVIGPWTVDGDDPEAEEGLLSQADAERVMDEFLKTFME